MTMTTTTAQPIQALDLTKTYPRSPGEMLGPYCLLPRVIDKCRAVIQGTPGEYNFNCPLDQQFFSFVKVDAEAFKSQVAQGLSDAEILDWVNTHAAAKTEDEILCWVYDNRTRRPEQPEYKAYYEKIRLDVAPHHRHISTWFELLDAEEGRLKA